MTARWFLVAIALFVGAPTVFAGPEDRVNEAFHQVDSWQIEEARAVASELYRDYPTNASVMALLGELKFHSSDYSGAVALFERAKASGASEELLGSMPLAAAADATTDGYAEAFGEHFVVRYVPGRDSILVPYTLETLEAARRTIGDLLGFMPKQRIVVELYPSAATLATVSTLTRKEIETSGTIALCKWNRLMVTSPRAVVFGYAWRDTLAHELAHLIIGSVSRNTVPIWMHEGLAKFVETAWRGAPGEALSPEQERALLTAAKKGTLIPFERMHPSMAKLSSQEETSLAFAEVFTFIEYLVAKKGWAGIRGVIELMARDKSNEEAIAMVFDTPLKTLADQWMAELPNRKARTSGVGNDREIEVKERPDAPDDSLHGLSPEARRFARAADLLFARGRIVAAQKELEKALVKSDAPQVRTVLGSRLARVAMATGDFARAEKAARATLELEPEMPGANVILAEALVRQDRAEEAREPLRRALAVNPFDPTIHELLPRLPGASEEVKERGRHASLVLSGKVDGRLPLLGTGGLIKVEGPAFARVLIEVGEGNESVLIPTGRVTPTEPFGVRPGKVRIHLVPPEGPKIVHTVDVPRVPPGAPPVVVEATGGS